MLQVLIAIVLILIICGAIGAVIRYAPFIGEPFKTWALYVVGVIALVLVIVQLVQLFPGTNLGLSN